MCRKRSLIPNQVKYFTDEKGDFGKDYSEGTWLGFELMILEKEKMNDIRGNVYFVNEQKEIYALLNTHTNLFSYMKELKKEDQEFFVDLANDTKDDQGVYIYLVQSSLIPDVDNFLINKFKKVTHYDWIV